MSSAYVCRGARIGQWNALAPVPVPVMRQIMRGLSSPSEYLHSFDDRVGLSTLPYLIGLLANPNEPGRNNVPPLRVTRSR